MSRKVLFFLGCSILSLAVSPAFLRAQSGPPPGGPPPFGGPGGGFGGRGGFRVIGVEGCLGGGRPVPSGTSGYAASILRDRKEASFSGTPTDHSSTELSYRDNNGVTYTELTLPAFGGSQTSRTVICINDPNLHIRLVVNPANSTAREFQLPQPPSNGGQPRNGKPNGNNGQTPPANPNVTITHPAPPGAVSSEITTYCPDAQTTEITRTGPNGTATSERVFCPALRLELYSQNSDSHGISTTTATITATGTGVNLAALTVPYPLPSSYTVTVETPGRRGRRGPGGPGGPQ
jgi:hypothetical protein